MAKVQPVGYVRLEWRDRRGVWQIPGGPISDSLEVICYGLRKTLTETRHERGTTRVDVEPGTIVAEQEEVRMIRVSLLYPEPLPFMGKVDDFNCPAHKPVFSRTSLFCFVMEFFDALDRLPVLTVHLFLDPEEREMKPLVILSCGMVFRRDQFLADVFDRMHGESCERRHSSRKDLLVN